MVEKNMCFRKNNLLILVVFARTSYAIWSITSDCDYHVDHY